jgi:hypothetical protein
MANSGGAFVPGNDYTVTGVWTFTQDPVFPSSGSGPIITNPTIAGTVAGSATYTTPTLTTPVISTGLTASGTAANDFSGSSGTFKTSTGAVTLGSGAISITGAVTFAANKNESVLAGTSAFDWSLGTGVFKSSSGANQLSGAVTISDTTTPSLTTAAGSTNTGFVQLNGKTSGALKFIPADATGQTVSVTTAAQTVGATTLTIPNFAGVSDSLAFITLAQTISNKTLDVTNINQAFKTLSTQTFTSNATLTNLTGLSWAVAAGGTYYFDLEVPLLTETTNGGAQMAFKLTTATLTQVNLRVNETTDTDNAATNVSTSFTSTTDQATWFNQKTTVFTHVRVRGSFTVGTAGSIAIQAAQNTSAGGGDATTFAGTAVNMVRTA